MWHAVGPNHSTRVRESLFFGYGYRWLRPMDYVTMPAELLERCDPIRRQLLGDASTQLGLCTFSDGTGRFAGFQARIDVSYLGGPNYAWDGTYSFEPDRD